MAKAKPAKVEAEPETPAPAVVAEPTPEPPKPLTGAEKFRAEFLAGEVRALKWKPVLGQTAKVLSKHGLLCFADGSEVELPTTEASGLVSQLKSIRPNDNIQLI
jgi:hypothetical protein